MRALVLSGGAVHGAYQVGVLKYLVGELGLQYDILCGVSVGALNCGYLSMYPKEQEKEALKNLELLWSNINDSKIKKSWLPFGVVHGLWLDSIYNSQPLIDLVESSLSIDTIRKSGRSVAVGAVSLHSGIYRSFTSKDDSFVDAILASSSYPMGLKPINIEGEKWTDGGVKHSIPMQEAIDFGATDIDVIVCSPPQTTANFKDIDTVTLGFRCFEFMTDQMNQSDLKIAELYNRLVNAGLDGNKRYINIKKIQPSENLQLSPLSFDGPTIIKMIEKGYKEAKEQFIL